jgi:serine/threonine-protein kinase
MAQTPQSPIKGPPARDTLVGQMLMERYTVLERQGSGGMSIVYRARHELLHKTVAIKVLRENLAGNQEARARFHREARAAASIDDPHIVDITDYGFTDSGEALIVMEYLEGRSLRELLREQGALEPGRCVAIMRQILKGLARAHEGGVIHRDLKSDNVFLLQREGKDFVKLLDFGISKVLRPVEGELDETGLTFTGVVMGTPQYIAPEQAHGVERVDLRADLYSAGVIFYEMLTGKLPFTGRSALEIMMKQVQDPPVPPRQLRPDLSIPESLEGVVLRALRKEREQRYTTASEMLQALPDPVSLPGGFSTGAMLAAPLPQRTGGAGLWAALALGLVLLLGGGSLVLYLRGGRPAAAPPAPAAAPDRGPPADRTALRRRPDASPSPDAAGSVTIQIKVLPASAAVLLDGEELGRGQVRHRVARGGPPLSFQLRARGYQRQTLSLTPDRDQSHELQLKPLRRPSRRAGTPMGVKRNPYR